MKLLTLFSSTVMLVAGSAIAAVPEPRSTHTSSHHHFRQLEPSTNGANSTTSSTNATSAHLPSATAAHGNGFYNNIPRPPGKIDIVNNTFGHPTSEQVHRVRFRRFCKQSREINRFCKSLFTHVTRCAGVDAEECDAKETAQLLQGAVDQKPCDFVQTQDALTRTLCENWNFEANRCLKGGRRGPCNRHHSLYLLHKFQNWIVEESGGSVTKSIETPTAITTETPVQTAAGDGVVVIKKFPDTTQAAQSIET